MKVFVTGATGLIGAHTVKALLASGHSVRLLARKPEKAYVYFRQQGVEITDIVKGDMLDKELIKRSLLDCDAVIHAAGMVSLDPNDADMLFNTNVNGLLSVLGTAHSLGIQKILYVSSVSALFDGARKVDVWGELNQSNDPYARSKIACESYVRSLQTQGVPVKITYPGMVLGPEDPGLTTSNKGLLQFIQLMVPLTTSGVQMVDARDLAELHIKLLNDNSNLDPVEYRYVIAGHYLCWRDVVTLLNSLLTKPVKSIPFPGFLLRLTGKLLDALQKIWRHSLPLTVESTRLVTLWQPIYSDRTTKLLGRPLTPIRNTIRDTLSWAIQEGHLIANLAATESGRSKASRAEEHKS